MTPEESDLVTRMRERFNALPDEDRHKVAMADPLTRIGQLAIERERWGRFYAFALREIRDHEKSLLDTLKRLEG